MTAIPEGFWKDAKGCLVPESMIKPIDRTRDELAHDLGQRAKTMSASLRDFKTTVFNEINAFVDLSAEQYDVKLGGKKGNLTLYSFDGAIKIQVAIAEHMVFDDRLQAAKHLIDECIIDWSQGSRDEIKVLVQSAFQTDKEGKINTGPRRYFRSPNPPGKPVALRRGQPGRRPGHDAVHAGNHTLDRRGLSPRAGRGRTVQPHLGDACACRL